MLKNTNNHGFPLKVFTSVKESDNFLGIRKTAADQMKQKKDIFVKEINVHRNQKKEEG